MDFLVVLLISVPVFYVWGLISFFRMLGRGNKIDSVSRRLYLEAAIRDLTKEIAKNKEQKLTDMLATYQEELNKLPAQTVEQTPEPVQSLEMPAMVQRPIGIHTAQHTSQASVQNWYKDNSINLLLYIGAFLIVVSATIYVSLPNATGVSKGLVLSALTLVFLFSGLWFHAMPRIKNAGTAFTGIGALLIPVCGLGWYNFVFKGTSVSFGLVWIITTFIGLFVYIILARYFKSVFYSYVTGFSTLSFVLAFFNMQGLQNDFYVLGAILSSIVLLSISLYLKKQQDSDATLFLQPFAITANITMPVAIAYALFLTSQSAHFTIQSTGSILLGCFFYLLSYRFFKKSEYLFAAQILFTLGLIYLGFWLHLSTLNVLYILMASLIANLSLVVYFTNRKMQQETIVAAIFSVVKPAVIFFFAQMNDDITPVHLIVFANITMIVGIALTMIRKNAWYLSLSSIFLSIGIYVLMVDQFKFEDKLYVLGLLYTVVAAGWYVAGSIVKKNPRDLAVCLFSCAYFFVLSTGFIGDSWKYQLFNAVSMSVIAYLAFYQYKVKQVIYLGNTLLAFAVFTLLKLMNIHIEFYPFVFVALSYVYYLFSTAITNGPAMEFRISGLLGAVLAPVIFGFYSYNYDYDMYYDNGLPLFSNHLLEKYSLISSYITFLLYGFDASSRKSARMGYTASVIGMLTYLWQLFYLGIHETQYYTFVIGAYFFTLAYIQRRKHNISLKQLFDILATFFLMVPTWFQSFGDNGAGYALVLGMIGVSYLVYSITYQDKFYRYAGILGIVLAVVSQSKWAIIGLAGLFFLGFALYLLIYRKEDQTPKQ